jgi:hypothetical protein
VYLAALISFLPSTLGRCRQALKYHSIGPFSLARLPAYIEYNRAALSPVSAQTVQRLQNLIPAREPFVAWISQPYHFDFFRNPILDAEPNGLATNWVRLPPSVRYVIWEYQGYGVRTLDYYAEGARSPGWHDRLSFVRALNFVRSLNAELKMATVIYIDDRFVGRSAAAAMTPARAHRPTKSFHLLWRGRAFCFPVPVCVACCLHQTSRPRSRQRGGRQVPSLILFAGETNDSAGSPIFCSCVRCKPGRPLQMGRGQLRRKSTFSVDNRTDHVPIQSPAKN